MVDQVQSIKWNNRRLDELNVDWLTLKLPTSPTEKVFEYKASAMDGSYDYSTYNTDNRSHFEDITISGQIHVVREVNNIATNNKIAAVTKWLHSARAKGNWAELQLDERPGVTYWAKVQSTSDIAGYDGYKNVTITVEFKARPFPKSGSVSIPLAPTNDVALGFDMVIGSWFTRPTFTLTGALTKVVIKSLETGKLFTYTGSNIAGDILLIDFPTVSVYKNGISVSEYADGDGWELNPFTANANRHEITVTGTATVTVTYDKYETF